MVGYPIGVFQGSPQSYTVGGHGYIQRPWNCGCKDAVFRVQEIDGNPKTNISEKAHGKIGCLEIFSFLSLGRCQFGSFVNGEGFRSSGIGHHKSQRFLGGESLRSATLNTRRIRQYSAWKGKNEWLENESVNYRNAKINVKLTKIASWQQVERNNVVTRCASDGPVFGTRLWLRRLKTIQWVPQLTLQQAPTRHNENQSFKKWFVTFLREHKCKKQREWAHDGQGSSPSQLDYVRRPWLMNWSSWCIHTSRGEEGAATRWQQDAYI